MNSLYGLCTLSTLRSYSRALKAAALAGIVALGTTHAVLGADQPAGNTASDRAALPSPSFEHRTDARSGKTTRAGETRFRAELAECDQLSGDERTNCRNGMFAARDSGLYRD